MAASEDSISILKKRRSARRRKATPSEPYPKRPARWLYGINLDNLEWLSYIPQCPVYYPSKQDFEDPFAYLERIAPKVRNYGICKIVSPLSNFLSTPMMIKNRFKNFKFEPTVQPLKYGTWQTMEDKITYYQRGRNYKYEEFERMADAAFQDKFSSAAASLSPQQLELEFWQEMASGDNRLVEYGVNLEGSAFADNDSDDELGRSKWNLKNLSRHQESTLRLLEKEIPGITDPMLYIGMLFSTFAWHVEDHYLYSINYHHTGAPKTWYGVPGLRAKCFEKVAYDHVYSHEVMPSYEIDGAAQVLSEKTTMLPPLLFLKHHVPVFKAVQMPGDFVVTFPRSYHSGFSHGFNCAEAVNFAMGEWFPYGSIASKHYSFIGKSPLIPFEELLCKEAILLCEQMRSETIEEDSSSVASFSQQSIISSCSNHMAYYRSARRKLIDKGLFFQPRQNDIGTIYCGFCGRDRSLAFLMCHCCQFDPTCISHDQVESVNCYRCGEVMSLYTSDDLRAMEAARDYFEQKKKLQFDYMHVTVGLQKEILELCAHELGVEKEDEEEEGKGEEEEDDGETTQSDDNVYIRI